MGVCFYDAISAIIIIIIINFYVHCNIIMTMMILDWYI